MKEGRVDPWDVEVETDRQCRGSNCASSGTGRHVLQPLSFPRSLVGKHEPGVYMISLLNDMHMVARCTILT